ncbi:hypothetical protein ACWGST_07515 [Agromyces sp. NPDC055520]
MRSPRTTAPLLLAPLLLALALSACTASPASGIATTPPTTAPPADAAGDMLPDPDAPHACGQVSALEGIRYRSDWQHDQGLIDDIAYASRVAALEDSWTYMVAGLTDISPSINDAKKAVAEGGISRENDAFQLAVGEIALACDEAGSLVSISALPGQGG